MQRSTIGLPDKTSSSTKRSSTKQAPSEVGENARFCRVTALSVGNVVRDLVHTRASTSMRVKLATAPMKMERMERTCLYASSRVVRRPLCLGQLQPQPPPPLPPPPPPLPRRPLRWETRCWCLTRSLVLQTGGTGRQRWLQYGTMRQSCTLKMTISNTGSS